MVHAAMADAAAGRGARADDARAARRSRSSATCSPRRPRPAAPPRCSSTPPCATSRSSPSSGLPIWARWVRVRGATRTSRGALDVPVAVGGATIRPGDVVVLDADGVAVVEAGARRRGARGGALEREEKERVKRAKLAGRRAVLRPRRPARARRGRERDAATIAHIGHAELLTPEGRGEPALLRRRPRDGDRGARGPVGLPARLGRLPALQPEADRVATRRASAHMALRAWSPEALERRVAAIEASRARARAGSTGDVGHGPAYRFTRPRRPRASSSTTRPSATTPPEHLRPSLKNQPQRYTGRGAAVKRLDHVNVLAADVRANREFASDVARLPPVRAHRARRRHRGGRVDERDRSPPTS